MRSPTAHEPSPLSRLQRDPLLPKPMRQQLRALSMPPPEADADPAQFAQAVADLRWVAESRPREAHRLDELVARYVEAARRAGARPLGTTAVEADAVAMSLRLGVWIETGALPAHGEVVMGGFMVPDFYEEPAEPEAPSVPEGPPGSRLFQLLSGGPVRPTPWSRYREHHEEALRPRLDRVKLCLGHTRGLVGVEEGSWCNAHHFAFTSGAPLGFTWRAWGDLVVALQGHGHYFDWYG